MTFREAEAVSKPSETKFLCLLQSTFSKTDTSGTLKMCLSQRDVRLIESQLKGVKERQRPTLGVRFSEVSVL